MYFNKANLERGPTTPVHSRNSSHKKRPRFRSLLIAQKGKCYLSSILNDGFEWQQFTPSLLRVDSRVDAVGNVVSSKWTGRTPGDKSSPAQANCFNGDMLQRSDRLLPVNKQWTASATWDSGDTTERGGCTHREYNYVHINWIDTSGLEHSSLKNWFLLEVRGYSCGCRINLSFS